MNQTTEMVQLDIDNVQESTSPQSSTDEGGSGIKRRNPTSTAVLIDPASTHRGYESDGGITEHDRSNLLRNSSRRSKNGGRRSSLGKKYPPEYWKTFIMLIYALCCLIAMTIIETIVHDNVPEQNSTAPLNDVAWRITAHWPFNTTTGIHACFRATEIIGLSLMSLVIIHIILHRHTSIVLRRFLFHFGSVYLYRVLTIYVTILPVPKLPQGHCMPRTNGTVRQILERSFQTLAGGGMDITGKNMCGDYMYSGHTCVLTSTALFIMEYSPKRWWFYHYLVQIAAIIGVLCISISHEHYTIDILVAYYVCTHHFWTYHTLAASQELKTKENVHLHRVWWFRIFQFMEGNINPIPRHHINPITKIKRIIERIRNRSPVVSAGYSHL